MKNLNLGCGKRFSKSWINIDFNSEFPEVISCNFLQPLPFPNNSIDAIYSSHALEHFSQQTGENLLRECFRVLKPHGILRIVVPDLEQTCREYLRVMDMMEHEDAKKQYEWITIELLDQLVRTEGGGLMKQYWSKIFEKNDESAIQYVEARTGVRVKEEVRTFTNRSFAQKLRDININKLKMVLTYSYIEVVKMLIPGYIRQAMVDNTPLGEKHKWMYDRHSLRIIFEKPGFTDIRFLDAYTSSIPNFKDELLDINLDGTPYKPGSLYCEGMKPKD